MTAPAVSASCASTFLWETKVSDPSSGCVSSALLCSGTWRLVCSRGTARRNPPWLPQPQEFQVSILWAHKVHQAGHPQVPGTRDIPFCLLWGSLCCLCCTRLLTLLWVLCNALLPSRSPLHPAPFPVWQVGKMESPDSFLIPRIWRYKPGRWDTVGSDNSLLCLQPLLQIPELGGARLQESRQGCICGSITNPSLVPTHFGPKHMQRLAR